MNEIIIKERESGDLFIRDVRLPKKGDTIPGHKHNYDHTMFFMQGTARLTLSEGERVIESREITAPFDMLVAKNILHEIEALTDGVYFSCVFPHRNRKGEVVEAKEAMNAYV